MRPSNQVAGIVIEQAASTSFPDRIEEIRDQDNYFFRDGSQSYSGVYQRCSVCPADGTAVVSIETSNAIEGRPAPALPSVTTSQSSGKCSTPASARRPRAIDFESLAITQQLLAELHHQYIVAFEPGTTQGWHSLVLRARKPGLFVRARSGYMVK